MMTDTSYESVMYLLEKELDKLTVKEETTGELSPLERRRIIDIQNTMISLTLSKNGLNEAENKIMNHESRSLVTLYYLYSEGTTGKVIKVINATTVDKMEKNREAFDYQNIKYSAPSSSNTKYKIENLDDRYKFSIRLKDIVAFDNIKIIDIDSWQCDLYIFTNKNQSPYKVRAKVTRAYTHMDFINEVVNKQEEVSNMKVGFSLSGVVREILNGNVKLSEIEKIFSATALKEEHFERWINECILPLVNENVTREEAVKVVKDIFESGKLYQPRLMGYGDDIYNPFGYIIDKNDVAEEYKRIRSSIDDTYNLRRFRWADELLKEYIEETV